MARSIKQPVSKVPNSAILDVLIRKAEDNLETMSETLYQAEVEYEEASKSLANAITREKWAKDSLGETEGAFGEANNLVILLHDAQGKEVEYAEKIAAVAEQLISIKRN